MPAWHADAMRTTSISILAVILALVAAGPVAAGPTKAQARVDAAAAAYEISHTRLATAVTTIDVVAGWSVRWLDAQREQPLKGKALAAAAQAHRDRMIALEAEVTKAVNAGTLAADARAAIAYYRAEAEVWVERKGKR